MSYDARNEELDRIFKDGLWFVILCWIAGTEVCQHLYGHLPPNGHLGACFAAMAWFHRVGMILVGVVIVVGFLSAIGAAIGRLADRLASPPPLGRKNKRKDRGKPSTF